MLRILRGRPYPDRELTPEVTPLEAGLWHTVSFTKGCYLGQETIAKVRIFNIFVRPRSGWMDHEITTGG